MKKCDNSSVLFKSSPARTDADVCPSKTSFARFGPDNTKVSLVFIANSFFRTSEMVEKDFLSIPLEAIMNSFLSKTFGSIFSIKNGIFFEGIAMTQISEKELNSCKFFVIFTFS